MTITEKAAAKINLGLDICGRHEDGYHELAMLMISVDLNDYISLTSLEEDRIIMTSNCHRMPLDEKNDVVKVAQLVKDRYGIKAGLRIHLEKNIPICAGLGGGSSDAAATLRGLNRLWHLNLSMEDLIALGFEVGSDVPFCLQGQAAYIAGKGEKVECLGTRLPAWVVLVKPDFGISTRKIFKEIDLASISRVPMAELKEAFLAQDYPAILANMGNSLEDITIKKRPLIQKIKDRMMASGADIALMTGSGPTVFALCSSEKRADRVVNSMKGFCKQVYKVRTLT